MNAVLKHRKKLYIGLGLFLFVLFIVKVTAPIVPAIGPRDTEVGETVSETKYLRATLDKSCYTTEEIEAKAVVLTLENKMDYHIRYQTPTVLQVFREGKWYFLQAHIPTLSKWNYLRRNKSDTAPFSLTQYGETLTPGHYRVAVYYMHPAGDGKVTMMGYADEYGYEYVSVEFDVVE